MAQLIVSARRAHPSWGPRKLLAWLEPRYPDLELPAISTAGDLLARRGLVKHRRRRRQHTHPGVVPVVTHEPNDLWTADFKGHLKTRDGIYCYPLTVADQHTRFLLACHGLPSIHGWRVRPGLHGLSQLNVWWMRLGIVHQRIRPARPQENGCHERMHKTLKYEATKPPQQNRLAQQRRFATFQGGVQHGAAARGIRGEAASPAIRARRDPIRRDFPRSRIPGISW